MSTRSIEGARILITGASSGIGRELARALLRQGADVVVTARREDRLRELADEFRSAGRRIIRVVGDITDMAWERSVHSRAHPRIGCGA
jgi:NADP-dependent 3-hydroxy acid dehydrogenase YdfG